MGEAPEEVGWMSDEQRPSRRGVLKGAALLGLAGCASTTPEEPAAPDPHVPVPTGQKNYNVVVIMVDDQRWDALSLAGHPFLKTPHIDAIGREGAWCKNAFVTTSLCCPSRATMLCGQYAHAHGVLDNQTPFPADVPTWPALLQASGYRTAYVGKWHMGGADATPRPHWDHWLSFPGQGRYNHPGEPGREDEWAFNRNGESLVLSGYVTDLVTDQAVDYIGQQEPGQRFAMVVGHKACHAPFIPAKRHEDLFTDVDIPTPLPNTDEAYKGLPAWLRRVRRSVFGVEVLYNGRWASFDEWYLDYHRTLVSVDEGVGRILEALEQRGLTDETLVVYTSDNGFMVGERGVLDKRCAYEPSMRVPALFRLPGVIPQGTVCEELVINNDLASTVLDVAGLEPPATMQGRSLMPLLRGEDVPWRDAFLYEYFFERSFPQFPTVLALRTRTAKLISYHGIWERAELYDLVADPDERNNLIDKARASERKKRLWRRLHAQLRTYGARWIPQWGDRGADPADKQI